MRNIALKDQAPAAEEASSGLEAELLRLKQTIMDLGRLRSLRDPLATMCEDLSLSPAQLHCIVWLGVEQTLTMGELARRLGVTEKTMTGLVDRLETSAHLKRERDAADRRVVRARLTDEGHRVYETIDHAMDDKFRFLLGLLDVEDRRALSNIFERLRDRLLAQVQQTAEESR